MKLSEFEIELSAPSPPPRPQPLVNVFVPARSGTPQYIDETIDLCMGICPRCKDPVTTHLWEDGSTFYECVTSPFHYYRREKLT